jgi:2-polyprenyl-6-methoxyphenol hydroxylase-like FAD-dependent oxidoreductase
MRRSTANSVNKRILVSGAGIAGLTLGILLQRGGWEPLVIERDPAVRQEGYIIDLFGTGWEVAERIGIIDALKQVSYPLDHLAYVDRAGRPLVSIEMDGIKRAFNNKFLPLRRSDLERALFEKAQSEGLEVRFGTSVRSLNDNGSAVEVEFEDGVKDSFSLVFGADGAHSRTRQLVFGEEEKFARFLGASVAAFHTVNRYGLKNTINLLANKGHLVAVYPISEELITTIYLFRNESKAYIPQDKRLALLQQNFRDGGGLGKTILEDLEPSTPIFLDSFTQILMPSWSKGRVVLLGDACGCLTMISGQGSHVAMGEADVIARGLEGSDTAVTQSFLEYEKFFRPVVRRKQDNASRLLKIVMLSTHAPQWLSRIGIKLILGSPFINFIPLYFSPIKINRTPLKPRRRPERV